MKPICAACQYDLSGVPGTLTVGWRCPECGVINQVGIIGASSNVAPFLIRSTAVIGLSILNVLIAGVIVRNLALLGFSPYLAIAGTLVLVEGVTWQFAVRSRYFRMIAPLRWLLVSGVLAAGTITAMIAGFFLLLRFGGGPLA
ncbi:MAG TPA: hypothetical protein VFF65_11405 [Phycisphaerales bacterium]|nr:hypothetical protein [Phycisphaerales bacterium]